MTSSEVADRLGVSPHSVRQWADGGKLGYVILPSGERRFTLEGVDALLQACERHQATT
jgi:excisionase family DNA binding protein